MSNFWQVFWWSVFWLWIGLFSGFALCAILSAGKNADEAMDRWAAKQKKRRKNDE